MLLKRNNVERVIEDAGKAESMIKEGYTVVEANNLPEKDNPEEKKPIDSMNMTELKALAKKKGLEGYSALAKDELAEVLKEVE